MNKVVPGVEDAVADIPDGVTVLIGGFGGSGLPANLGHGLAEQGARDLTVVCNDPMEWLPLVQNGQVRKLISGFTAHPLKPDVTGLIDSMVKAGKMEVETLPHRTVA